MFSFYFPGVLIGPSTRFVDYRAWANGSLYGPTGSLPSSGRIRASLFELLTGMAYMGAWAVLSPRYDYANLILPMDAPGSPKKLSPLARIGYAQLAGLAARTKYYGVWTLTNVSSGSGLEGYVLTRGKLNQGACILSGLSYNGPGRWDRCKNVKVRGIEFANNWKELLDSWNMNTSECYLKWPTYFFLCD